ncbi:unnamed protein product [Trichogramma brassicae]|uniref:CCHC-type domain-containing protein n=1 Tax=Trichogramma brassicae TaxID=86971 RepID=A0A6H5I5S3_9HYME|nr:unnamed protein product [Trichogramma brassicae]
MEIMEDGNLLDRVRILLQRDMQYYEEQQTVLREPLCVRVSGGQFDFPRHASFAAVKMVMWWEAEFELVFVESSGLSPPKKDQQDSGELGDDDLEPVVKKVQPDEIISLIIETAEQLLEHLHKLIQESLDHADLTVLTATLGAAALIRNTIWLYHKAAKPQISEDVSEQLWKQYEIFSEMVETIADRLLDLHKRLISLYILNEAESIGWDSEEPFFEKKKCSFIYQMWWLYMKGQKVSDAKISALHPVKVPPLTHTMFHIGDEFPFDRLLHNYDSLPWELMFKIPLGIDTDRVRQEVLCRTELIVEKSKLPKHEREAASYLKQICTPESTNMATGTNNGKVRTRAQVEQFKQRMEALVRLEAPSMVWAKIRELPIQAVMEKLQQRRLSISGDEETLRVRLFRARCKALPNSNQLDVPWDPETDEEPEQDEKSLNETILQTKNHEMEIDQAQGGGAPPVPTEGVFTPQMIAVLTETIRREVGIAVAQEIAKLSRGEASADAGGASAGLGLRSSPSRDSGLTPKIRKPPRKMPRKMVTVEDRDMEEVQETSTPWDPKTPLGLLPGRLGVNEEPSDESESDSEREPVNWRGRQTQRSWPKTEPAMVTPTDHVRAEQRWKWARMLRDTGLTFSGAKDKLGAETFLARLERYRTKGAIPQEDMLFAVDALLVGEAQVWYESVEHKLHSWQDFERRFRRSFANQATPRRASHRAAAGVHKERVAIAFRGIRPEYRNFIAHRENKFFQRIRKSRERIRETVPNERLLARASDTCEPTASEGSVQASASQTVCSCRGEFAKGGGAAPIRRARRGSHRKRNLHHRRELHRKKWRRSKKTQAPQSNRYGERRTQWKNSNLQPSRRAIRKELRCTNCKQQGHWTTNCPTIECFNATRRVTWREHALNQKIMWKEKT